MQFFRRIPVIAMKQDPAIVGKLQMRRAADALLYTGKSLHAEQEIPGQECPITLYDLRRHDKAWRIDLRKHVPENLPDRRHALHFVERILEERIVCNVASKRVLRKRKRPPLLGAVLYFVVGRAGFEPATNGLKVRCSTS